MFQSPSLRGSGRFGGGQAEDNMEMEGFNPLHCGAVVASMQRRRSGRRRPPVSIPFIAGQWSLPPVSLLGPGLRPCFNPLHCGAVVASLGGRVGSA